mmetsp:Transcript_18506/g.33414  ORF Transcript_18506/g.33414 Transcript_18506/m.33414 type:complete len:937 (+) Transcript_18506:204-3014(+)
MQRPTEIIISQEELDELKAELRMTWAEHDIPLALQSSFESCVYRLSRRKVAAFISKEMLALQERNSAVLHAMQAVRLREASLSSLRELAAHIELVTDEELQTVAADCAELLETHRMLSLSAVDMIVKWREGLVYALLINNTPESYTLAKKVAFMWEGQNYLVKMKTDNDFLKQSSLSRLFNFSSKNDPFLVIPSNFKEYSTEPNFSRQTDGRIILNMPGVVLNKVRLAELVLMAESSPENQENLKRLDIKKKKAFSNKTSRKPSRKSTVDPVMDEQEVEKIFITRPDSEALLVDLKANADKALPALILQELIGSLDVQLEMIAKEARADIIKASVALHSQAVSEALLSQLIDQEVIKTIQAELEGRSPPKPIEAELAAMAVYSSGGYQASSKPSLIKSSGTSKASLSNRSLPRESATSSKKTIHQEEEPQEVPITYSYPDVEKKTEDKQAEEELYDHQVETLLAARGLQEANQKTYAPAQYEQPPMLVPDPPAKHVAGQSTKQPPVVTIKQPKETVAKPPANSVAKPPANSVAKPSADSVAMKSEAVQPKHAAEKASYQPTSIPTSSYPVQESSEASLGSETPSEKASPVESNKGSRGSPLRPSKQKSKSPKKSMKHEVKQEQLNKLYSRKKNLNAFDRDELAYQILSGYIREFSEGAWINLIAETVLHDEREQNQKLLRINTVNRNIQITQPEDYGRELFTPGAHSPNAYSVEGGSERLDFSDVSSVLSDEDESEEMEMYPMKLARRATMVATVEPQFTQMKVKNSGLRFMLMDYYSRLPDELLETVCPFEELWRQYLEKEKTCSWFWMVADETIMGLVVLAPDKLNLEALHFSTLSVVPYANALRLFLSWVWTATECSNVRINLYSKLDEFGMHVLNRSIKAAYDKLGFKWRSVKSALLPDMNITVMGYNRPPGIRPREQEMKLMQIKFYNKQA